MPEASDGAISEAVWPSGSADAAANRSEWETSRTLTAERRRADGMLCTLFEACVGTRITLPEYNVSRRHKHRTHANTMGLAQQLLLGL